MKLHCRDCPKVVTIHAPRGAKVPRRWRCNWCIRERSVARQKARTALHAKRRAGLEYPSKDWNKRRVAYKRASCEMCGAAYRKAKLQDGEFLPAIIQHIHHLIPGRMAEQHGDPHAEVNCLSVCAREHGMLKRIDNLILEADWLGAVQKARAVGLPLERLAAAAEHYGFGIRNLCS